MREWTVTQESSCHVLCLDTGTSSKPPPLVGCHHAPSGQKWPGGQTSLAAPSLRSTQVSPWYPALELLSGVAVVAPPLQ